MDLERQCLGSLLGTGKQLSTRKRQQANGISIRTKRFPSNAFIWGYTGHMESRKFNGTSWENELPAMSITATSNVRWISVKPDPVSNQLVAIIIDGGDDLNSVLWNGTIWGSPVEHCGDVTHTGSNAQISIGNRPAAKPASLEYGTRFGFLQNPRSSFHLGEFIHNIQSAGHPWIQLRKSSRNADAKILGATLNGNQDLFSLKWDEVTLTLETTAFTTDTATVARECFDMAFQSSGY